ncbi:Hypothetical predicted protein, partial [Olea europaea subsp. europaea]
MGDLRWGEPLLIPKVMEKAAFCARDKLRFWLILAILNCCSFNLFVRKCLRDEAAVCGASSDVLCDSLVVVGEMEANSSMNLQITSGWG